MKLPTRSPILIPEATRASEVRALYHGCGLRQFYDWALVPDRGYAWFHVGTGIHLAIEQKLEDPSGVDLEDMRFTALNFYYSQCKEDEEAGIPTRHSTKVPDAVGIEVQVGKCLTNFLRHMVKGRYLALNLYATELEALLPGFRTTIDAVFCGDEGPDAGVDIVDWKTGTSTSADPIQLYVYRWALERLGYKVKGGWFHHLYSDKIQEVDWDAYDAEYVGIQVKATGQYKRSHIPPSPTPGWYCKHLCPYKQYCPEYVSGVYSAIREAWKSREWTTEKVES